MNYSVTLLKTAAECDALISSLNADKKSLEFRKISMDHQRTSYETNAVSLAAELQGVQVEIDAVTAMIATLPEGSLKDEQVNRLRKAEYKKFVLGLKQKAQGAFALIDREVEVSRADLQIGEVADAIAQVEARKAAL